MGFSYLHKGILCYLRDGLGGHPRWPHKTDRYDTQEISTFLMQQSEAILGHFPFISKDSKGLWLITEPHLSYLYSVELNYSAAAMSQISFKCGQVGWGSVAKIYASNTILMILCIIVYFLSICTGLAVIPQELQEIYTFWNKKQKPSGLH